MDVRLEREKRSPRKTFRGLWERHAHAKLAVGFSLISCRSLGRERMLGGVLLGEDLLDLGLALHGALNGQLGGLVVVLVNLGVVLRHPVDEDTTNNDEVL